MAASVIQSEIEVEKKSRSILLSTPLRVTKICVFVRALINLLDRTNNMRSFVKNFVSDHAHTLLIWRQQGIVCRTRISESEELKGFNLKILQAEEKSDRIYKLICERN